MGAADPAATTRPAQPGGPSPCPKLPVGLLPPGKFTWDHLLFDVLEKTVPPRCVLQDLAHALVRYAGKDGTSIHPGYDTLARQLCCGVRSVGRAFSQLEALGLVYKVAEARGPGRGRKTTGRAAEWVLTMRAEHELAMRAAGWRLEWAQGRNRRYLGASKTSATVAGVS